MNHDLKFCICFNSSDGNRNIVSNKMNGNNNRDKNDNNRGEHNDNTFLFLLIAIIPTIIIVPIHIIRATVMVAVTAVNPLKSILTN